MADQLKKNSITHIPRTLTILDVVLIAIALGGAMYSIPLIHTHQPSSIVICRDNTILAEYTCTEDREIPVSGNVGPMIIEIKNGKAAVISSTCKKQLCVKAGAIQTAHQQLVCAPNHILIEIRSNAKGQEDIDAIAR
jgi:hypothetical protein